MEVQKLAERLVSWLQEQVAGAGCKGVVFGLSGGIDSAVVAGLAKLAFGEEAIGIIMPCHSNPEDAEHAMLCANAFDLPVMTVDLTRTFDTLSQALPVEEDAPRMAVANIKPRLRMTTLYYYASLRQALVLGTGNRSEVTIGYFTKYGDGGVDLMPIAGLVKQQVRELAAVLGVPQEIINKAPSAGLWDGQTDENEMGLSYAELDHYILAGEADERVKSRVDHLNAISAHKRCTPPIPEL